MLLAVKSQRMFLLVFRLLLSKLLILVCGLSKIFENQTLALKRLNGHCLWENIQCFLFFVIELISFFVLFSSRPEYLGTLVELCCKGFTSDKTYRSKYDLNSETIIWLTTIVYTKNIKRLFILTVFGLLFFLINCWAFFGSCPE